MVNQELEAKSQNGFNRILRFSGFLLSLGILYFMVVWTLDLSKVEVGDLPVISALDEQFKRKPPESSNRELENSDLSINSLRGKEEFFKGNDGLLLGNFEETLNADEKPVPLSMQHALEDSINEAINTLAKNDLISQDQIYQIYLGSFDDHELALATLKEVSEIGGDSISDNLNIVAVEVETGKLYRLETTHAYSYEKAKQVCKELMSFKLDCKVVTE